MDFEQLNKGLDEKLYTFREPTDEYTSTVDRKKTAEAIREMVDRCEQVQYGQCPRAIEVDTILEYARQLENGHG